jgi:hypothetical protein
VHFFHWNFLVFLPLDPDPNTDPDPQSLWIRILIHNPAFNLILYTGNVYRYVFTLLF